MEPKIIIRPFQERDQKNVANLIIGIQRDEFGIDISLNDQPDLADIRQFYQSMQGNFWCAVNSYDELVGTIALIDIEDRIGVIRKMFVRKDYRGKETSVAKDLLDVLENWAQKKQFTRLYLGTVDKLRAAQKFYHKNDYTLIDPELLPSNFPRMAVDNLFFVKTLPVLFGGDNGLLR
jgi:N-acetylglutamate synthase-like GNAT family acetyltransferase